jgi:hypothetical protein
MPVLDVMVTGTAQPGDIFYMTLAMPYLQVFRI